MRKRYTILLIFFLFLIFLIAWTQPNFHKSGTIKIWDRNNTLLYESVENTGNKIPVSFDQIPQHLINAAIASEDSTFWTNPGVDIKAMLRATYENIKARKIVSGASTITQQLARNSIISPNKIPSRSIIRKVREALIAFRITAVYSKKDILTMYLNQMYFGNLAYGVQAASTTYFNKDVSQLSLAESAFLVGLLSSPDARNPFTNLTLAKKSQSQVIDLMVQRGFISNEQADQAKQEEPALDKNGNSEIKAPHFVQYILQKLDDLNIKTSEGINIYTTLDYPIYSLSADIAKTQVARLKDEHDLSNAALILIKNDSGEILNMLGGIDYFDEVNSGQVNMTTALRQPGSAMKPVTYAAAFMQGYTSATVIYDVKKVYKTKNGEGYTPNNYDGKFHGLVLAREALASSLNLPAVEMLNRVGIGNFLKVSRDLGITTLNEEDRYDLSLTLGGGEVNLVELANVYSSFARRGNFIEPYGIQNITNDSGKLLYEHKTNQTQQVLGEKSKEIAYLISDILSDPKARIMAFGEKNPLVLSHPAAVKTGTTTDWHDNWTIGYTPSYTVGVWVGNNDNHPMKEITGIVGAAPIWNQFFEEFLKGNSVVKFGQPESVKKIEICALDGLLPGDLCSHRTFEFFIDGTQPKEISQIYKKVQIDSRNGLLSTESCPEQFVLDKVLVDYPNEVYTWAVQDGQNIIPNQVSPLCPGGQNLTNAAYLDITYPKEGAVFETAPLVVTNEAIVFEVNTSVDIVKVFWYLDGQLLAEKTSFPYSASWKPQTGKHLLSVYGVTGTNTKTAYKQVSFTVLDYKSDTSP